MNATRHGKCWGLSGKRVKWQRRRKRSVIKREVSIDFYIRACFKLKLKSSNGSIRHIVCDKKFEWNKSTITRTLEELLSSTDLVNEVEDMLLHTTYYQFMPFSEHISKFIHKEVSALGTKYQTVKITVKFDDITLLNFDEKSLLIKGAGFKIVECNNLGADKEACPICLERLMDSDKDETMIIMRAPCEHMFHENCIITWMKRKQTCPMCRFNMKIKFQMKIDEQIWRCETDFQDLLHVTLDS